MIRNLLIFLFVVLAIPSAAQSDDRGILQAFIEDNLSDAGREVRIEGFRGALSSRAELDRLTVADDAGIWLTIEGATLDWNRSAVLRGNIEIRELSAETIIIARAPQSDATDMPSPEATPIAVPELPVAINIDELSINRLELGPSFLGSTVELRFAGAAELAGGAARLTMDAQRLNGPQGRFEVLAAFENASRNLTLDVLLDEARNGLAATLIGLPGTPEVELRVAGDGPLDDFEAEIELSTDGTERVAGSVTLQGMTASDEATSDLTRFSADLAGDLRPLIANSSYHPFLGSSTTLSTTGERSADGALRVDALDLQSDALDLTGSLALASDGWPQVIDVTGQITPPTGDTVVLPLGNPDMRVAGVDFVLGYSQEAGDTWQLSTSVDQFSQPGLAIGALDLRGGGVIDPVGNTVSGSLTSNVAGLATDDDALNAAIGDALDAALEFVWQPDAPLVLRNIALSGTDYRATGSVEVSGVDGAVDLAIESDLRVETDDLSRFSDLAGQDLGGQADLAVSGNISPVSGAFDVVINGTTTDLRTGIAQVDPIVRGTANLSVTARRNQSGIRIDTLTVEGDDAFLGLSGQVGTNASTLALNARLGQVERILDGLTGAASLSGTLRQQNENIDFDLSVTAPGDTLATLEGSTKLRDGTLGDTTIETTLRSDNLSAFRRLSGTQMSGAVTVRAIANGHVADGTFSADLMANGSGLRTGNAQADLAVGTRPSITANVARDADGTLTLSAVNLQGAQLTAALSGQIAPEQSALRYDLSLRDVGAFVSQLRGPLTATGSLSASQGPWQIDTNLTGPGGTTARVSGMATQGFDSFDLGLSGSTALALANTMIVPNLVSGSASFDLRLLGPPDVSSLSGIIRSNGAQFTSPGLPASLTGIDATVTLASGQARIDARADVSSGGAVTADGTVGLIDPFRGDLAIDLSEIILSDPGFVESSLNGALTVRGPLAGGANVAGQIDLGQTEIRIPDAVGATGADVTGLVHLNEPAAVRRTRIRAGLIKTDEASAGASADYPLNVVISAPSRVFIRGRGLDAELGGRIRLTGTVQDVITQGRFELIRGRLDILGQRLTLSEASAQLLGDFDPRIRAVATTQAADTSISIIVEGTASSPDVSFASSPTLPEDEILARLLVGRELSQISAFQALRIANAIRVLSGQAGEGIVGRLREGFGLDDLDVTTTEDNTTAISAGRYLNENVYTGVTVDSAGKSEINLNLSVSPSVTLRGNVDSSGNSGVGIFFERDY